VEIRSASLVVAAVRGEILLYFKEIRRSALVAGADKIFCGEILNAKIRISKSPFGLVQCKRPADLAEHPSAASVVDGGQRSFRSYRNRTCGFVLLGWSALRSAMDDLLLPLTVALATTAVASFVMAAFLAVLRDLTLRKTAGRCRAIPSRPLQWAGTTETRVASR
jgi:hypothetical protein